MSNFQVGDWVRFKSKPGVIRRITQVFSEERAKTSPYDPIRQKLADIVITKNGEPVDYREWFEKWERKQWARGVKYQTIDDAKWTNDYFADHKEEGLEFTKSMTTSFDSLILTTDPTPKKSNASLQLKVLGKIISDKYLTKQTAIK